MSRFERAPGGTSSRRRTRPERLIHRTEDIGDVTVLHLAGKINHDTVPILSNALEPAVQNSKSVILDATHVTFIDASGFRVLETCDQRAHRHGHRVTLAAPSPCVDRLIKLLKLDQVVPVFASIPEALRAVIRRGDDANEREGPLTASVAV